jgi:hypothetical protein
VFEFRIRQIERIEQIRIGNVSDVPGKVFLVGGAIL